ncbi:MAG: HPr family phosphocarrier protein [Spirochaetaceae bacterium]|nr:MAG: HPr family phosphocarrier protein [Spirochaetaceae bacterium]
MIRKQLIVTNPKGIHARPSGMLHKTAMKYDATILLANGDIVADCREIMLILTLGAIHGDTITMTVEGPDEEAAAAAIEEIFAMNFHDND